MATDLEVKIGPQYYHYGIGAISNVEKILEEYKAKNILIVHGSKSWKKAEPFLLFLRNKYYNYYYHRYTGECSYYGAELINNIVEKRDVDFIIGVGGGKLVDLVGYASHLTNTPFGVIPTLASNCAPWTPLSIMYKESGESEGISEHYYRQSTFLITDPELVIDSPIKYFVSGIADTLAKWYESDAILKQPQFRKNNFINLAQHIAITCKDIILNKSTKAIRDMKNKIVSDEFIQLSEIVFGVAGMIGGLGDKYARNAVAHAMHDSLGKYANNFHDFLHGEIVAYGILYQMALEERWDEINQLLPFYKKLNLPCSLNSMGIYVDDTTLSKIIDFIHSKEKVHLLPIDITKERLTKALYSLEKYILSYEGEN